MESSEVEIACWFREEERYGSCESATTTVYESA